MNKNTSGKTGHLTYLFVLLACCLMVGASLGLCFYSAGVFYEPISEGLHITIGQAGLSTTFMLVCMAFATLGVPMLMRAIPYRYLLIIGTVLAAAGTLGMAFCFHTTFLYVCSGIQGVGAALIGLVPATTILNRWFYSNTSAIMALCTATPALLAALFSPLFGLALQALGWRMALVIMAGLIVLLLLPALLLPFAPRPEILGMQPWGIRDLEPQIKNKKIKHPIKIFLAIAGLSIMAASLLGISQHFSGFGASLSRNLVFGASMFSWCMIGSIAMKLLGGFLGEKIGPGLTTALLDAVLIIASIGMWISIYAINDIVLKILAFLFGAAYALSDFSVPLLVKDQYGPTRYARIYSFMNFLSTVSIAVSIAVVGFIYDGTMTYAWVWGISIVLEIAILGVTYVLIREEKRTRLLASTVMAHMPESIREKSRDKKSGLFKALPRPIEEGELEDEDGEEDHSDEPVIREGSEKPDLFAYHSDKNKETEALDSQSRPALSHREEETNASAGSDSISAVPSKPYDHTAGSSSEEEIQDGIFTEHLTSSENKVQPETMKDSDDAGTADSAAKEDAAAKGPRRTASFQSSSATQNSDSESTEDSGSRLKRRRRPNFSSGKQ